MRSLVRTLGSLLIAFGAFLWLYAAKIAPSNKPVAPVAVVPAARPAPPPSKSRHHNEAAVPKEPAPPPSHPAPPPVPEPKRPAISTLRLFYVNPEQHEFFIDLHKQDGWFDTGIPVSADVMFLEFCPGGNGGPPNGGWVHAMIGNTVLNPQEMTTNNFQIVVNTFAPGEDTNRGQGQRGQQYLEIPAQTLQTLKLKIDGDGSPDEIRQVAVKIYVRPKDPNQPLSPSQQREQAELGKWVKQ